MAQLRRDYPEILKRNAEILQITHNTPEEGRRYAAHYELGFPYLCDADRAVHERYGMRMITLTAAEGLVALVSSATAAATDLVVHGEATPSPLAFFQRHDFKDAPQAVFVVDSTGIIRAVHVAGPRAALPPTPLLLKELDAIG
jgi:alkyl hydroperoxide reductase subunit AhpC